MNIGIMFPGQGSQHVGMGKSLLENFNQAKLVFEEASDAVSLDLKKLCIDGPESDLKLTQNTQPALLVTSIAAWNVLSTEFDIHPTAALGHSLGEYSALAATKALTLREAVKAVRQRGQFMQEAVPVGEGGMTAVLGVEDSMIEKLCHDFQSRARDAGIKNAVLEPANYNCPGQVVVSGHLKALELLKEKFVAHDYGAKAAKLITLPVSAPFHCSLMKPVADRLAPVLKSIKWSTPSCHVVHNVTGMVQKSAENLPALLTEQVLKPVLWTASIHHTKELGVTTLIELGSGKVLSGLVKKIDRDLKTFNVEDLEGLKSTVTYLKELP